MHSDNTCHDEPELIVCADPEAHWEEELAGFLQTENKKELPDPEEHFADQANFIETALTRDDAFVD